MLSEKDSLYRAFQLVIGMIKSRPGWSVEATAERMNQDDFVGRLWGRYSKGHPVEVDVSPQSVLVMVKTEQFKQKECTALLRDLKRGGSGVERAIVIVQGKFALPRHLVEFEGYRAEFFELEHVLLDVIHHRLQPQFQVLSAQEKEQVLSHFNASTTQIPSMKLEDPVARYFALRRGDMIMCIRESETAGKVISYRVVLE